MRKSFFRLFAPLAVAVVSALGLSQPAWADSGWHPVSTDGSWHCTPTQPTLTRPEVFFQGCTVVSGHNAQIVLIVVNHSGQAVTITGGVEDGVHQQDAMCSAPPLGAGQRAGCFSETTYLPCDKGFGGYVHLYLDGKDNGHETPTRSAC